MNEIPYCLPLTRVLCYSTLNYGLNSHLLAQGRVQTASSVLAGAAETLMDSLVSWQEAGITLTSFRS